MNLQQMTEIALAGFPALVQELINFNNLAVHKFTDVYRLHDADEDFSLMLPNDYYLSIHIGENNFIQIESRGKAFNHYAAIKKMEELGLIKE